MHTTVSSQRRAQLVRVRGEVDISTAYDLQVAFDALIAAGVGPVVVDLSDLDFIDSSGMTALVRARTDLALQGRRMSVACPPGHVHRLFEIVELVERLDLHETLHEALAAVDAA